MGYVPKHVCAYLLCKNVQNYEKFVRFLTTTVFLSGKCMRCVWFSSMHMHNVVCVVTVIRSKQNCSLCAKIECICIVVV